MAPAVSPDVKVLALLSKQFSRFAEFLFHKLKRLKKKNHKAIEQIDTKLKDKRLRGAKQDS
jgi:hypothetical protein